MAASGGRIRDLEKFKMDLNDSKIGKNLSIEINYITFDSDKTFEVPTDLSVVLAVFGWEAAAGAGAQPQTFGSDLVITSGAVTVSCSVNNALTYRIALLGYV